MIISIKIEGSTIRSIIIDLTLDTAHYFAKMPTNFQTANEIDNESRISWSIALLLSVPLYRFDYPRNF